MASSSPLQRKSNSTGGGSVGESSTDPSDLPLSPPPPLVVPLEFPIVPSHPSKASPSSVTFNNFFTTQSQSPASTLSSAIQLRATLNEDKDVEEVIKEKDEEEEEEEDKDEEDSSNAFSCQHWGPERCVEVVRVPGKGLGISIVGGKVDPVSRDGSSLSPAPVTGIFIKNVLEGSLAGDTNQRHTGDRILGVDGHDLRTALHDQVKQILKVRLLSFGSANIYVFFS